MYQLGSESQFETSPVVFDGVMYISEPPSNVTALDLRTGRRLWRWERHLPKDLQTIGFGRTNRGVAVLNDMVYIGTLDAHLVALDAKSGAVRWDSRSSRTTNWVTASPPRRSRSRIKLSPASAAAKRAFADFLTPTTPKPASGCGASGPSPRR